MLPDQTLPREAADSRDGADAPRASTTRNGLKITTDRVNIREVAEQAKVSVATVSLVLNKSPRISRATSLRVQKTINDLGYQPNRLAQSLSGRYTYSFAILLPALRHAFADAYFGEIISGICDRAGKMGYKVILEQAKPQYIKDRKHVELFERRFVDGVLCAGFNDKHRFLADFGECKCPMVLVDNKVASMDHVVCDYRLGAEQALNAILQLGHRSVALIYAAPESQTARQVAEVYARKLADAGIPFDKALTEDGCFTDIGGAAAAEKLMKRRPDITAILANNDKMALGAIRYLQTSGRNVPKDVSIVGFDDLQHSAFANPSLTTVHLPLYEAGGLACERLLERVHGKIDRISENLPTHLVLRESTSLAPILSAAAESARQREPAPATPGSQRVGGHDDGNRG